MGNKYFKAFLGIALFLILANLASAQRQTGSIVGKVVDEEDVPLPGASLTLNGPALMGTLVYTTTEGGYFRFPLVPPGSDYVITVQMPGFQSVKREGIIVNVGKTVTLTIQIKQVPIKEEITVTAKPPTVDTTSTKISFNYTKEVIQQLPVARDYYDVIKTAPGVIHEEKDYYFRPFVVHGGTVRSNRIALDGINIRDPYTKATTINFSFDIIEEIEFETGGHPAEVGMTEGSFINLVTKSGGNELHGQTSMYLFNKKMVKGLIPDSELESVGLTKPRGPKDLGDLSFSLGGPILKDKFWFFLNARYIKQTQQAETLPDGVFDNPKDEIMATAKLTFNISPSLKFMAMWSFVNSDEQFFSTFGIDYYETATQSFYVDNRQDQLVLGRIQWLKDKNTYFDAKVSYYRQWLPMHFQPDIPLDSPRYYDFYTQVYSGAPSNNEDHTFSRFELSLNGTRFLDGFLGGNHEIKAGVEYEKGNNIWDYWRQNPYLLGTYQGLPWGFHNVVPYMGVFRGRNSGFDKGDTVEREAIRRFSVYFQDSITIKDRLTFNLGLRYDESHGDMLGGEFNPAGARDPVLTMLAPNVFKKSIIKDFKNAMVWRDISPRFGAVFDFFGDGKTTLKASWSRYNEYLGMHYLHHVNPAIPFSLQSLWSDTNQNGIIEPSDSFTVQYSPIPLDEFVLEDNIDPDLKSPYMDEFILGIERELFKDFSISLSYIYKKNLRIIDDVDKRGYTADSEWWVPYTVTEPGWDGQFGTADDAQITAYGVKAGAPMAQFKLTNPEEAKRKYQALEFIFNKRWSRGWQLLGSITWSKFKGNTGADIWYSWGYYYSFDNPNYLINRYGRIDFDRPVQIKIQGSVVLPFDIMLSGYFYYMSGKPWARTLQVQLPFDPAFEYPGTFTSEFNAETPGSRRYQSRENLDLRLEKIFNLRKLGKFGIFLDVFNVFGERWYEINQDPGGYVYADGTFERWPTYGDFTSAQGLRIFKLGARFTF